MSRGGPPAPPIFGLVESGDLYKVRQLVARDPAVLEAHTHGYEERPLHRAAVKVSTCTQLTLPPLASGRQTSIGRGRGAHPLCSQHAPLSPGTRGDRQVPAVSLGRHQRQAQRWLYGAAPRRDGGCGGCLAPLRGRSNAQVQRWQGTGGALRRWSDCPAVYRRLRSGAHRYRASCAACSGSGSDSLPIGNPGLHIPALL